MFKITYNHYYVKLTLGHVKSLTKNFKKDLNRFVLI